MRKSAVGIVLLLLLVAAVGVALYGFDQAKKEGVARAQVQGSVDSLARQLSAYRSLAAADSLFHAGNYERAMAAYETLAADSLLPPDYLPARLAHVERLGRLRYQLDTLRRRSPRVVLPPPPLLPPAVALPPAPVASRAGPRPPGYDSLTLALRQAQRQVADLQTRLRRHTGPHYLTFRSGEGNETWYVGAVRSGKAEGRGVALLSTGSRYVGEWENNRKHGEGEFRWSDGARYVGEFADDKRAGQGTYYFPDGGVYVGGWKNGLRHGQGVLRNAKGKVIAEGVWRGDELVERR